MEVAQRRKQRPKVIDLNLLPEEYRPRPWRVILSLSLVALIAIGCVMAYFQFDWKGNRNAEINAWESQIAAIQAELVALATNAQGLMDSIALAQEAIDELDVMLADWGVFSALYPEWYSTIYTIIDVKPDGITLMFIGQSSTEAVVVIGGEATAESDVIAYAQALEGCGLFSEVSPEVVNVEGVNPTFQLTLTLEDGS